MRFLSSPGISVKFCASPLILGALLVVCANAIPAQARINRTARVFVVESIRDSSKKHDSGTTGGMFPIVPMWRGHSYARPQPEPHQPQDVRRPYRRLRHLGDRCRATRKEFCLKLASRGYVPHGRGKAPSPHKKAQKGFLGALCVSAVGWFLLAQPIRIRFHRLDVVETI